MRPDGSSHSSHLKTKNMSGSKAAGRYAKSLIELANEQNALEDLKKDMLLFGNVVGDHSELEAILKNPIIPLDKKAGILQDLFGQKTHLITQNFFKLLVSKGRANILFAIAKEVIEQYNQLKGIIVAKVVSASPLDDAGKAEVVNQVKAQTGAAEVSLQEEVNPQLIGGLILTVGDRRFDGSVAGNLNKLKKELARGVA